MIDIDNHPIWQGSTIFGKVNGVKRHAHILQFKLAKQYAKLYSHHKFIGITGTVGKTSTALACKKVLEDLGPIVSTTETSKKTANLDPIFNLPQTLLRVTPKTKRVILEMGIEYKGEMDLWLSLVHPATAIITAIGYQHSEFLGDLDEIAKEKGRLIEQLPKDGKAILNYDDPICRKLADKTRGEVIFFGTDSKKCHVWADNIKVANLSLKFGLNYGVERVEVETSFIGKHQIYPLLAAAALGLSEGLRLTQIKRSLEKIQPGDHRLQALQGVNGSVLLDDSYNAAPVSVLEALETLNYISARRRILVMGEMRELGKFSEKMHREIAHKIYKDKLDLVFLGIGETKYIFDELLKLGFPQDRIQKNLPNPELISILQEILTKGDVVLIKGARGVRLDEVVEKLVSK